MVDWDKIKTLDDLWSIPEDELYDQAPDFDAESDYILMPGLTTEEIDDAMFWKDFLKGIALLTGGPGQGKGMLMHMIAYKLKKYFGKVVVSDTRPRQLFGQYVPFDEAMLVDQLDRMWEVATGQVKNPQKDEEGNEIPPHIKPHVTSNGRWVSSRGDVFLRRSIIMLDEFARYMHRREPHLPIKRQLLKMFTIWRHLRCIILGVGTERADFDSSCFPKVTCEIRTTRIIRSNRLLFKVTIYPLRFIRATGELEVEGKPIGLILDGDMPRSGTGICEELGTKGWKDIYNTDNAIAMEPPKSMRKRKQ